MTTRRIAALFLMTLASACGSPGAGGTTGIDDRAAVWQIDEDANLAYPTCWSCGADIDRGTRACDRCDARVHIEAKTIACPECNGSKACTHCDSPRVCLACNDTHDCAICDGAGTSHGTTCPDCEGKKDCGACRAGATPPACERCDDQRACANCESTGTIVLK